MSAEQNILNRLQAVGAFNPSSGEFFTDWALQAGDVVSVEMDGQTYRVPIYGMSFDWGGSAMVNLENSGSETRDDLAELTPAQKYAYGSRAGGSAAVKEMDEHFQTYETKTDRHIGMTASALGVKLDANGNPIVDPNDPTKYIWDDDNGAEIYSRLALEHNRAELISAINDHDGNQISGAKIDLSAQGSVIIQAINGGSGSTVQISADHIDIDGALQAYNGFIASISTNSLHSEGDIDAMGEVKGFTLNATQGEILLGQTSTELQSFSIDNVEVAKFLGTGPVNFDRATARREGMNSTYISPSDIVLDTSDYQLNSGNPYYDLDIEATASSTLDSSWSGQTSTQTIRVHATEAYRDGRTAGVSSVVVTLTDTGWQTNDASTGDYTRTIQAQKNGVDVSGVFVTVSGQQIWNLGYNAGWMAAANGSGRNGNTVSYPISTIGRFGSATASITGHSYSASTLKINNTDVRLDYDGTFTGTTTINYRKSVHANPTLTWT